MSTTATPRRLSRLARGAVVLAVAAAAGLPAIALAPAAHATVSGTPTFTPTPTTVARGSSFSFTTTLGSISDATNGGTITTSTGWAVTITACTVGTGPQNRACTFAGNVFNVADGTAANGTNSANGATTINDTTTISGTVAVPVGATLGSTNVQMTWTQGNSVSSAAVAITVTGLATPTIATTASPDIVLGAGTLTDSATVSGRVNPLAGASVEFRLYGPNDAT
ncbi:MAG TPA: hypothetical protein VNA14_02420, partial [Mycobacteriales bacterium]|nr:hypothetical protein [Mycobacteriales bacterium]